MDINQRINEEQLLFDEILLQKNAIERELLRQQNKLDELIVERDKQNEGRSSTHDIRDFLDGQQKLRESRAARIPAVERIFPIDAIQKDKRAAKNANIPKKTG